VKAHWNNLNDRERGLVLIAGISCFVYLLYILLYSPLSTARDTAVANWAEKQATLQWMEPLHQFSKTGKAPQLLSKGNLLTEFANQLKVTSFQSFPFQLEQTGSGEIQLSFEEVPYNALVSWLWSLSGRYRFSIKQFNADKKDTPGLVKAMVVITAH